MLCLKRKLGQAIFLGENIVVRVIRLEGGDVTLGVDAPNSLVILREELYYKLKRKEEQSSAEHSETDDEDQEPDPDQQV